MPPGAKILLKSISNTENFYSFLIKKLGDKNIDDTAINDTAINDAATDDVAATDNAAVTTEEDIKKYILLKLFFSDDFIETLFIFEYFIDHIALDMANIQDWCLHEGLEYAQLRNALFVRNSIINTLCELNINPYHNESLKLKKMISSFNEDNHSDIIFNTLKGIKMAIYGGYFNNLLMLNSENNSYYNNQNIKIKLFAPFINLKLLATFTEKEYKPKWIITNTININANSSTDPMEPAPLLYSIQANKISIMDGFVYPDFEYTSPKLSI